MSEDDDNVFDAPTKKKERLKRIAWAQISLKPDVFDDFRDEKSEQRLDNSGFLSLLLTMYRVLKTQAKVEGLGVGEFFKNLLARERRRWDKVNGKKG